MVGKRGPALCCSGFISDGLPEWGHLGNLGLWSDCSSPFGSPVGFVRRSVSWYHYSAGGDSVAPDLVPSGGVCLGGGCCELMRGACARSMCSGQFYLLF